MNSVLKDIILIVYFCFSSRYYLLGSYFYFLLAEFSSRMLSVDDDGDYEGGLDIFDDYTPVSSRFNICKLYDISII